MRALVVLTFAGLCACSTLLHAQTRVDLATQSRGIDFSGALSTKPSKTGSSLPATCSVGEMFFKINAAPGKNLYACTASNIWALVGPSEMPAITGSNGHILANDGVTATWSTPSGDVTGTINNLSVGGLQGRTVNPAAPIDGDVLTWDASQNTWKPATSFVPLYGAGTGVAIMGSTLAVDSAIIPQYAVGSGVPSLACFAGRDFYTDTASGTLYFCRATDTWQAVGTGGGAAGPHTHSTTDLASGTLTLPRGGTNQPTWSAGKCVQVSADGTKLESAGAGCSAPVTPLAHTHATSDIASGTVTLPRGGTNQATWVAGKCVQVSADGTKLESTDASCSAPVTPLAHTHATSDLASGTVTLPRGGTNQGTWVAGKCVQVSADGTKLESTGASCSAPVTPLAHTHDAADTATGTFGLARGGTNQTSWNAGSCVQVSADGTRLESYSGSCGSGGGGGGGPVTSGIFMAATPGLQVSANATHYFWPSNQTTANATRANREVLIPVACTMRNLFVRTAGTQYATGDIIFRVAKNGTATTLALTVAASSPAGVYSNTTQSVSFAAGDLAVLEIQNTSPSTVTVQITQMSVQCN